MLINKKTTLPVVLLNDYGRADQQVWKLDLLVIVSLIQGGNPLSQGIERCLCAIGEVQFIQDMAQV
jgi:hypothetical protein